MTAHFHRPGPPLDDFVACFWCWEGYTAPAPREQALPSGTLDIVINLARDQLCMGASEEAALERFRAQPARALARSPVERHAVPAPGALLH